MIRKQFHQNSRVDSRQRYDRVVRRLAAELDCQLSDVKVDVHSFDDLNVFHASVRDLLYDCIDCCSVIAASDLSLAKKGVVLGDVVIDCMHGLRVVSSRNK